MPAPFGGKRIACLKLTLVRWYVRSDERVRPHSFSHIASK
jgi:hypothetical protein